MNKIETFEQFLTSQSGQISYWFFLINLIFTAILAYLLGELYSRYGKSLSNRKLFAQNFLPLALTTMIIITIIKSSLALSLGLVGALSIIRFRSAIKEPEELTYVFICISIGLGLGAGQGLITASGFLFMAILIIFRRKKMGKQNEQNLHLTIMGVTEDLSLNKIVEVLKINCNGIELKRLDETETNIEASFLVNFKNFELIEKTKFELKAVCPSIVISLIDNKGLI